LTIDALPLLQAAAAAAGGQQYPAGTLYVVATPIGNLADLTLRAMHVLSIVDAVACEDTRVSAALLRHLGLSKPMLAVHEHNEQAAARLVIARLRNGERVAYLSDAGTPAVSDPGAGLVAAVQAAGLRSIPIPGASSVLAALSVAGDALTDGFRFVGFLPARAKERANALNTVLAGSQALILFEAPHRIDALLAELAVAAPTRRVTLCRELTKQFEDVVTLAATELPAWIASDAHRSRGEFVLVLHALAPSEHPSDEASHDRVLGPLLRDLPLKQAVALAVELTGAPRNTLYQRALHLRDVGASPEP
jgi:16S rRNA (cytidine1402-2'-O)-methyltransferase